MNSTVERSISLVRACATVRFIYDSTIALYNLRLSSGIRWLEASVMSGLTT
ncbi:uncharacterized protein METZ01_LOCUS68903, partial [marine metagenome]